MQNPRKKQMIVIYINNNWSFSINNDATSTVTSTDNSIRPTTNPRRWIAESSAPIPCSPPDYHHIDAQWNAEKKRRELAGIKAAQQKHARIKLSACKTSRKVLKYYREPNIRKELVTSQANENSAGNRARASNSTKRRRRR